MRGGSRIGYVMQSIHSTIVEVFFRTLVEIQTVSEVNVTDIGPRSFFPNSIYINIIFLYDVLILCSYQLS